MKIYLATDHAGLQLKTAIATHLESLGYEIDDCGAYDENPDDDYPVFVARAAERLAHDVEKGIDSRAVVLGKSGQGEAMVMNRFKGVRAAVYYGGASEIPILSREHNDANALSLGAGFIGEEESKKIVAEWLSHPFSGEERHVRRIRQIDELTKRV